jgi:hypothetical protein
LYCSFAFSAARLRSFSGGTTISTHDGLWAQSRRSWLNSSIWDFHHAFHPLGATRVRPRRLPVVTLVGAAAGLGRALVQRNGQAPRDALPERPQQLGARQPRRLVQLVQARHHLGGEDGRAHHATSRRSKERTTGAACATDLKGGCCMCGGMLGGWHVAQGILEVGK